MSADTKPYSRAYKSEVSEPAVGCVSAFAITFAVSALVAVICYWLYS